MENLITLFQQISLQPNTSNSIFNTLPISEFTNHRISKNETGNPILLINVTASSQNLNLPSIKLQNIAVHFDAQCNVSTNNQVIKGVFTIISFTGFKHELELYFLKLGDLLLKAIGNTPTQTQVYTEVYKLIELFKAANQPPLKSVQGLWAELLIIEQAKDTHIFTKAWHSSPTDKYDFSYKAERLEIKSSSLRKREHHFSLEQLTPPQNTQLVIASVFVEEISNGKSLEDLQNSITQKLSNDFELQQHLNLMIARTLGNTIMEAKKITFDYELAIQSVSFYDSKQIPTINTKHIPNEISNIHFKVNLSNIENMKSVKNHFLIDKY
ncbi:MAG: PD-(D/E)XK motif protein [Saprospiraceae bacterium]|nr:PD-(D/E)XK motif protein [Saprospiraceae bacterium]